MNNFKLFFKGFSEGFKEFSCNITVIVNSILLLIIYLTGIGLTAILAKLFNKSFLDIKTSNKETYWSDLNLKKKSFDEYLKQF